MHIGQLIKEQLELQGKTVVWLAEKLSCSRTNIYKIFDKASIDTSLLMRISIVLQYNFFRVYADEFKNMK